jgi:DTW domain-containing protein YfiP
MNIRTICARCLRPQSMCYCRELVTIRSNLRFVILQHPLERRKTIGTARLAHLLLEDSILISDVDFSSNKTVELSYPGKRRTIFVIDGTWSCATKIMRLNPALGALPRICLRAQEKSEYSIRRQPRPDCLSTIEAIQRVIQILDPAVESQNLLTLFRKMVARQSEYRRRF